MMDKRPFVIFALFIASYSSFVFSIGAGYFSHSYEAQMKYLTKQDALQSFGHQLESEFEYSADNYAVNGIVQAFADTEDNLVYPEGALDNFSQASKPLVKDKYGIDLRELYLTYFYRSHTIKLGKQQVAWGETDGIRILDIINPLDFREFLLKDAEDIRIPIWMLNYAVDVGFAQFQVLVVPDNTTSFPSTSDYMTTSPISSPAFVSRGESGRVTSMNVSDPASGVDDWDRAVNVSFSTGFGDFSVVYINQLHDIPVVDAKYVGNQIYTDQFFYRRNVGGISYSNAFSSWVLRSELAYSDAQYVYLDRPNQAGGLVKRKAFDYAIALDWSGLEDTTVTVQLSQGVLSGRGAAVTRDKVESNIALVWDQYFVNQTYQLRLLSLQNLNRQDNMTTIDFNWLYRDDFTISIGFDSFSGDRLGTLGQHGDADRLHIAIEYTF